MIVQGRTVASVLLALLAALFAGSVTDQLVEAASLDALGGVLGGLSGATGASTAGSPFGALGNLGSSMVGAAANAIGSHLSPLGNLGSGLATGASSMSGGGLVGAAANALGSSHANLLSNLGSGVAGAASTLTGGLTGGAASTNSMANLGGQGIVGNAANAIGSRFNPLGNLGSGGLARAASALGSGMNPMLAGGFGSSQTAAASSSSGAGSNSQAASSSSASRAGSTSQTTTTTTSSTSSTGSAGRASAASSSASSTGSTGPAVAASSSSSGTGSTGMGSSSQTAAASSSTTTGSGGLGDGGLLGPLGSTASGPGAILAGSGMNAATRGLTSSFGASAGQLAHELGSMNSGGFNPAGFGPMSSFAPGMTMMNNLAGGSAGGAALEASSAASAASAALDPVGATSEMLAGPSPLMTAAAAASPALELEAANAASSADHAFAAPSTMAAANSAALAGARGASSPLAGRTEIALEAMKNAQTEAALAGSEMVVNGANNARSASMASNAYRNAKLASARDRVNIAGTIQNAARISDATIATHDAAAKAEDSLLGSELALDSAGTVLDSDGAYIPPVTSSLLRSLPYGRLGLRNIVPKPLAHPSQNLPDVWLNGFPVRYANVPLTFYPANMFGLGPVNAARLYGGEVHFMQPFQSNNGMTLNGMVFDPAYAYLSTNLEGSLGASALPILANGQLEAQDEVAMANLLQMQQLNGVGMSATYQGYGRLNPVPMITGSVTDANLMPTTTIGTTYPIGSALVIEPRDSFFQDYNDQASSRQNMDERQQ